MRRVRRFGLLDAAVLALFAAAGLGVAANHDRVLAEIQSEFAARPNRPEVRSSWLWEYRWPASRIYAAVGDVLTLLVLGVGTAPLRRPGLLRERGWPPPGVVAGMTGSFFALYEFITIINAYFLLPSLGLGRFMHHVYLFRLQYVWGIAAGAILGAWTLLLVARRWRPKRGDPDDVLGRWVGYGLLATLAFGVLFPVFFH